MPRLPRVWARQLVRALEKEGFVLSRSRGEIDMNEHQDLRARRARSARSISEDVVHESPPAGRALRSRDHTSSMRRVTELPSGCRWISTTVTSI